MKTIDYEDWRAHGDADARARAILNHFDLARLKRAADPVPAHLPPERRRPERN